MAGKGESKGGLYVFFEFIGLYCRYFVFRILGVNKSRAYLSGEENFPKINHRQRFYYLAAGLFVTISFFVVIGQLFS